MRIRIKPWHVGLVVLMLALGVTLCSSARFELHGDAPGGPQIRLALLGAEELKLRLHFMQGGEEGGGPPQ